MSGMMAPTVRAAKDSFPNHGFRIHTNAMWSGVSVKFYHICRQGI